MSYTLKGSKEADVIRAALVESIRQATVERDHFFQVKNLGSEAPSTIWDLGTAMFEPGISHLPTKWVSEVCPEDLRLATVPTFKKYKSIVEAIQAAIVQGMPTIEFEVEGNQALGDELNKEWLKLAVKSRLIAELDLVIAHCCNYGIGWLGLCKSQLGDSITIRAIHPQRMVWDITNERPDDIMWLAKVNAKPSVDLSSITGTSSKIVSSGRWPSSITDRPEGSSVDVELWIRKGGKLAGRHWKDAGMKALIADNDFLADERYWNHGVLPIVPVYLVPRDQLVGESLAQLLWLPQVIVDKVLGVMLSRTSIAADVVYHLTRTGAGDGAPPKAVGSALSRTIEKSLRKPGIKVIFDEAELSIIEAMRPPIEMLGILREMISLMERLAGISEPFQGIAPRGITAGIAIQSLAAMSARRPSRMAIHLAEALREMGMVWATIYLSTKAEKNVVPRVKVALVAQEEMSHKRSFEAIKELVLMGVKLPPELVADLIPGISPDHRREIIDSLKRTAREFQGAPGQPLIPEGGLGLPAEPSVPPVIEQPMNASVVPPTPEELFPIPLGEEEAAT